MGYKKKIEAELSDRCNEIVDIVKGSCMSLASDDESKAFFTKMIGDYYRYVAESAKGDTLEKVKSGALEAYNQANDHC